MRLLTYLAAAILAAVFVVSGTAKWRDLPGAARSFRALGVHRPYPLARAVASLELADAVLLLVWPGVGALVGLGALVVFSVVLADALRRGVKVSCGCFGARTTGSTSWRDLARNAVLAAAALGVALVWGLEPLWA
ncbi:MAG: DoxX family membrane protein [Acidimicrobiia bacterium]|nr:DoxX family membrane protein [Acidimicrobiia bacterium]